MQYIVKEISNFIKEKINNAEKTLQKKLLITLPTLNAESLLSVAENIKCFCLNRNEDVNFIFKVAIELYENWDEKDKQKAIEYDWLDKRGNLTHYRNIIDTSKFLVIILAGAKEVTDANSLSDFFSCDMDLIWKYHMKKSFKNWLHQKLAGNDSFKVDSEWFDKIFIPIFESGRGDLSTISDWLDNFNADTVFTTEEFRKQVVRDLDKFNLPNMQGAIQIKKAAKFKIYLNEAINFFNYSELVHKKNRDKIIKKINILREESQEELDEVFENNIDDFQPYNGSLELLEGIRKYVLTENIEEREKLKKCDFIIIQDHILKFNKKIKKLKPFILRGNPIEVVLSAIWISLRRALSDYPNSLLKNITITGQTFAFNVDTLSENFDDEDMTISNEDVDEYIRSHFRKLYAGIDELIKSYLDIENSSSEEIVESNIAGTNVKFSRHRNKDMIFSFGVSVALENKIDSSLNDYKLNFRHIIPETNHYRLSYELVEKAVESYEESNDLHIIPAFQIAYYDELLGTNSEEEFSEVLLHSIKDAQSSDIFMHNICTENWTENWAGNNVSSISCLKELSEKYKRLIMSINERGLYSSILGSNGRTTDWSELFNSYKNTLTTLCGNIEGDVYIPNIVLRAFLILEEKKGNPENWGSKTEEKSGIVTILHPAMFEVLEAQILYLLSCFKYSINQLIANSETKEDACKNSSIWNSYMELAQTQSPILALFKNTEHVFETGCKGSGLFFRIGNNDNNSSVLSTRLLSNEDNETEELIISDSEFFKNTNESNLLSRLLEDYLVLHPHSRDGISLAIYRNKDIQPVISAIHNFIKRINTKLYANSNKSKEYLVNITFFSDNTNDSEIRNWISHWQKCWNEAQNNPKFNFYENFKLIVSHRLVGNKPTKSLKSLLANHFEADIMLFYDFTSIGNDSTESRKVELFDIRSRTLKFPILNKSCYVIDNPIDCLKRSRIITNRQFELSSMHTNLLNSIKKRVPCQSSILESKSNFEDWVGVINEAHSKSNWVICIDPLIDEKLLRASCNESINKREIIGFGSGVGNGGSSNYTISSEQVTLLDLEKKLKTSIQSLYSDSQWTDKQCDLVSNKLIKISSNLTGLSLVRATGVLDNHIRDFIAYCFAYSILNTDGKYICDTFVSLDAFKHWFDFSANKIRPDLINLKVTINENNLIVIKAHMIECKLGINSIDLLSKAKKQIDNGLKILMQSFKPSNNDGEIEDKKPDARYWWMQLHRLIASKTTIKNQLSPKALQAFERLSEGEFEIEWQASVFAFWLDSEIDTIAKIGFWETGYANSVSANIYEISSKFLLKTFTALPEDELYKKEIPENLRDNVNICDFLNDNVRVEDDDILSFIQEDISEDIDEDEAENAELIDNDEIGDIDRNWDENSSEVTESFQKLTFNEIVEFNFEQKTEEKELTNDSKNSEISFPEESKHQRFLLGTNAKNYPIYWEFGHEKIENRHLLVFGSSGTGKTYAIQALLNEMASKKQNSLILDYTSSFTPSNINKLAKKYIPDESQEFIAQNPLSINPFNRLETIEANIALTESSNNTAKRIAAIFKTVYKMGPQQYSVLVQAIQNGLQKQKENFNLEILLFELAELLNDKNSQKNVVTTVISHVRNFVSANPFQLNNLQTEFSWTEIFENSNISNRVFQFLTLDSETTLAIIQFILWDLFAYVNRKSEKNNKVIVLDEIQNLNLGSDSPVAKYLTEGRKFGLNLIMATQSIKGVGGLNDPKVSRLMLASHKLFFKPADNEMKDFAKCLHDKCPSYSIQEWISNLNRLEKGECWSVGPIYDETKKRLINKPEKIKILSLEERNFGN